MATVNVFGLTLNLDPDFGNNFIDANALDYTGGPEDAAVDKILSLVRDERVRLLLPYSVKKEIEHPNTPPEVKHRVSGLIYSMPVTLTAPEKVTHQRIRDLIQGNAKPGTHDADAFHLVEAAKYGRHFITRDARILGKGRAIWDALQLRVLTPSQFIEDYFPTR
jgi:hypothetical protein